MADYTFKVLPDYTGYLVSITLLKVSDKVHPDVGERCWQVIKPIQDLLPGATITWGYDGQGHEGLRVTITADAAAKLSGGKGDICDGLTQYLNRHSIDMGKIARFVEDKLNE